jgi:hypothetical protein
MLGENQPFLGHTKLTIESGARVQIFSEIEKYNSINLGELFSHNINEHPFQGMPYHRHATQTRTYFVHEAPSPVIAGRLSPVQRR